MPKEPLDVERFAVENRVRIETMESELSRTRDRLHVLEGELYGLRLSLEPMRELPGAVRQLSSRIEALASQALQRPTPARLSAWAAWAAVVVAVVALAATVILH